MKTEMLGKIMTDVVSRTAQELQTYSPGDLTRTMPIIIEAGKHLTALNNKAHKIAVQAAWEALDYKTQEKFVKAALETEI